MAEAAPRKEAAPRRKVTINTLMAKMRRGEQITQLAAYDYRTAVVADRLGMDILCVSDTGGMILFGHQSTVTVSFEEVMMMAQGHRPRLEIRPAHGRHAVLEFPRLPGAGGRQCRPLRARGQCRSDEVRRQPPSCPEYRGDRPGRHSGAGSHRHHTDAHAPARRLRGARQDRHSARRNWWTTPRPSSMPAASRSCAK